MIWAAIYSQEAKLNDSLEDFNELKKEHDEFADLCKQEMEKMTKTQQKIKVLQDESEDLNDDVVKSKTQLIDTNIRATQNKIKEIKNKIVSIKDTYTVNMKKYTALKSALEKEQEEFTATQQTKIQKLVNALNSHEKERETLNQRLEAVQIELEQVEKDLSTKKDKIGDMHQRIKKNQDSQQQKRREIMELESPVVMVGGHQMVQLVNKIKTCQWTTTPIGPLGNYVKIKSNFTRFRPLLDSLLAPCMTDFIVFNRSDQVQLQKLCAPLSLTINVTLRHKELFDFSKGILPHTVIYKVLSISNPHVERQLVDSNNIETKGLFENRQDALNCNSKFKKYFKEDGNPGLSGYELNSNRGKGTKYVQKWNKQSPFSTNQDDILANQKQELVDLVNEGNQIQQHLNTVTERVKELESKKNLQTNTKKHLDEKIRHSNKEVLKLNSLLKKEEATGTGVHDDLKNIEKLTLQSKALLDENENDLQHSIECLEAYNTQKNDLLNTGDSKRAKRRELEVRAEKLQIKLDMEKATYKQHRNDEKQCQRLMEQEKLVIDETKVNLNALISSATEKGPRLEVKESYEELTSIKRTLEKEQQDIEKQEQITLHDAIQKAAADLQLYESTKTILDKYRELLKCLKEGLNIREEKLLIHKSNVTASAKQSFDNLTKRRGYKGFLEIDHNEETLNIKLAVEQDQIAKLQHKRRKMDMRDVASLSGGEKSYASVCFLCSLWAHVPSPIRCLDEYDVFMDPLQRQIAIGILMEAAASTRCQYVFISPQDSSTVEDKENIKVHVLKAPTRK